MPLRLGFSAPRQAIDLAGNDPERAFLRRRLRQTEEADHTGD